MQAPASCVSRRQASCTTTSPAKMLPPQTPRQCCQEALLQGSTPTIAAMSEVSSNCVLASSAKHMICSFDSWLSSLRRVSSGQNTVGDGTLCCSIRAGVYSGNG